MSRTDCLLAVAVAAGLAFVFGSYIGGEVVALLGRVPL